ncbi:uncharacterized protein TNCV_1769741 [Trichonephila clavipes]|nr:uncharacterized protein TNCV_1769741 [Trichonephila clavipes]
MPDLRYFIKAESFLQMSPTQVRTISEYGVWIGVTWAGNSHYCLVDMWLAELKQLICWSLLENNAITGYDFNRVFFRKGKLKPYKTKKFPEYQEAFKNIGTSELIENTDEQQNVFNIIQRFLCNVYNGDNVNDVDADQLQMFIDMYTISDVNEADLPSRGCNIENLSRSRWWEGAEWLKLPSTDWPQSVINPDLETSNSEKEKQSFLPPVVRLKNLSSVQEYLLMQKSSE